MALKSSLTFTSSHPAHLIHQQILLTLPFNHVRTNHFFTTRLLPPGLEGSGLSSHYDPFKGCRSHPPSANTPRWLPVFLRVKVSPYADPQGPILLVTFPPPPFPLTGSVSVPLASCYCIKHTRHSSVSGTSLLVPSARSALPQSSRLALSLPTSRSVLKRHCLCEAFPDRPV